MANSSLLYSFGQFSLPFTLRSLLLLAQHTCSLFPFFILGVTFFWFQTLTKNQIYNFKWSRSPIKLNFGMICFLLENDLNFSFALQVCMWSMWLENCNLQFPIDAVRDLSFIVPNRGVCETETELKIEPKKSKDESKKTWTEAWKTNRTKLRTFGLVSVLICQKPNREDSNRLKWSNNL